MIFDMVLIGYAVNQRSGGYANKQYAFLDTSDAKYLYNNCFLDTYCAEPMAFEQLTAQMEAVGLFVDVVDGLILGLDRDSLEAEIAQRESRCFAFSIYESTAEDIFVIIDRLRKKRPNVRIVLGGPYATISAESLMERNLNVDAVVVGDGDEAMPLLATAIRDGTPLCDVPNLFYREGGTVCKTPAHAVELDSLLPPKRLYTDEIIRRGYSFAISASRGCGYAGCGFCYLRKYQKVGCQPKYRFKSAKKVFDEIQVMVDHFNVNRLSFTDEDFFGNEEGLQRAIALFHMLIDAGIHISLHVNARAKTVMWLAKNNLLALCAEAGVRYMYVGLESYNDEALLRYDKGITTADIDFVVNTLDYYHIRINPGLITFDPLLTPEQVRQNIILYRRIRYYDVFIFTRRLVFYPEASDKVMRMQSTECYFHNPQTEQLFSAMECYRDMVFPWCMKLNRRCSSNALCASLESIHFSCFFAVYDQIVQGKSPTVEEFANRAIALIQNVLNKGA